MYFGELLGIVALKSTDAALDYSVDNFVVKQKDTSGNSGFACRRWLGFFPT